MREETVSIGPRALTYATLLAAVALGVLLLVYAPDPLALVDTGGRPSALIAIIKWGGGLLVPIALWRIVHLKRVRAGPDGIEVATLLKRSRYDWSGLKSASLDGRPLEYALRFGPRSTMLRRSDYAARDIARLRDVVTAHYA